MIYRFKKPWEDGTSAIKITAAIEDPKVNRNNPSLPTWAWPLSILHYIQPVTTFGLNYLLNH